ncbi:hypothetical protein F4556_007538 [Kitasatospora gansuensis]|uniref:Uncharacterized protein n=1 Tax=Kitasatospora gansuensis TaxID=258050 RepID=A0A7W7WMJ5_9ACTN|nr:hypothetical protein [Kitasatospora gansuensis]MBB4951884.1 hypothetical protein [Kitasatospora gansuensis]
MTVLSRLPGAFEHEWNRQLRAHEPYGVRGGPAEDERGRLLRSGRRPRNAA